jgi:hypothetical protein
VTSHDAFHNWLAAAEARYLADLTRREVGRALRALSSCYVERPGKLSTGHALEGRGKRAAFALYYGPLHFLTVRAIARHWGTGLKSRPHRAAGERSDDVQVGLQSHLSETSRPPTLPIIDIGCGTGAAGAAWALETGAEVRGFDVSAWAVGEANWTYGVLGVRGRARKGRMESLPLPAEPSIVLAAFVVNELAADARTGALHTLRAAAAAGHQIVVIEPIARGVSPWWDQWRAAFEPLGGQARDWRFQVELPPLLRDFDKAAGIRHRELTARTLVVSPGQRPTSSAISLTSRDRPRKMSHPSQASSQLHADGLDPCALARGVARGSGRAPAPGPVAVRRGPGWTTSTGSPESLPTQ